MPKLLFGTYANGYTLSGASQGVLNPVSVTGSIAIGSGLIPAALYAQGPNTWTIANQGSIAGGAVAAVELAAGGSVVNNQSAFLGGHFGVAVLGGSGAVTNNGTVIAANAGTTQSMYQAIGVVLAAGGGVTNQTASQITGQGAGVEILGSTGTVVNAGTIAGPAYDGVYIAAGSVTNMTGAVIDGGQFGGGGSIGAGGSVVASGWGVVIQNTGSLFNAGMITATGQGGAILGGGTATNQGTISGGRGIVMGGPGTVTNSGYLDGTLQSGVSLRGGSVTNAASGRIAGVTGVDIRGAGGTVANSGFIVATAPAGYAVYLANGVANRLIDNPGARFTGSVDGGNVIGAAMVSTLELGAGAAAGTLSGLGTQFINFAQVTVDAGASWSLTGVDTIAAGATLRNLGSLSADGMLLLNGSVSSAGAMTVASTAGVVASVTMAARTSNWNLAGELDVGNLGTGSVTISNAASLAAAAAGSLPAMALGVGAGASGSLLATGAGSRATLSGQLNVGQAGTGRLLVESDALVSTGGAGQGDAFAGFDIAEAAGGSGEAIVTGTGSTLNNQGRFVVGDGGVGSLSIQSGATVMTSPGSGVGAPSGAVIANAAAASGSSVDVIGTASLWQVAGTLVVGGTGLGALSITQGAAVSAGGADEAATAGGDGVITVAGTGSALTLTGRLTVGDQAAGELSILGGGTVSALDVTVGNASAASSGDVDVEGTGSELLVGTGGVLNIGVAGGGGGVLTLGTGATLNFAGTIVEAGHASFNNNGGVVDPDAVQFTSSSNGGTGLNQYDLYVENIGAVQVASGTGTWDTPMVLTGTSVTDAANNIDNNGDTGQWQLSQSGTLIINANTVDAGQAIVFEDATDTLVIGQVVDSGAAGASGETPTIAGNAENLLQAGGFAAAIWGYQTGDRILFDNLIVASDSIVGGNTLELFGGGNALLGSLTFFNKAGNKALSAAGMQAAATQIAQGVSCFAAGTLIETLDGPVAVEHLSVGDSVRTVMLKAAPEGSAPRGFARVVWVGARAVNCRAHPKPQTVWPIRVSAAAFGENVPVRELYLSPDHAVFVNNVLVPVRLLINGTSVVQVKRDAVTYHHVELPEHAVILAEGLPVESYLDTGDRANFNKNREMTRLFPDFTAGLAPRTASVWETRGAAPLVTTGPKLAAARRLVTENARSHFGARTPGLLAS